MTAPMPQGDGADRSFAAADEPRSEMAVLPGWEWMGGIARTRGDYPELTLARNPWTLFGEVGGPLTVVTNGWFLLAYRGDVGYPVAHSIEAARLRKAVRDARHENPKDGASTRIISLDLLKLFVGVTTSDTKAHCDGCADLGQVRCPFCEHADPLEFVAPCHVCEGKTLTTCPLCMVSDHPPVAPARIGVGVFNRAILLPVLRRLEGDQVAWRQAGPEAPATIRAEFWSLTIMPMQWDSETHLASFPQLEKA